MLHWPWCSIYESIQDAGLKVILVWDEIQGEICLSIEDDKQDFLSHLRHTSPDRGFGSGLWYPSFVIAIRLSCFSRRDKNNRNFRLMCRKLRLINRLLRLMSRNNRFTGRCCWMASCLRSWLQVQRYKKICLCQEFVFSWHDVLSLWAALMSFGMSASPPTWRTSWTTWKKVGQA